MSIPKIMSIPKFESTNELLHYLYADLTRISLVSSPDIILHRADRALLSPPKPPIEGIHAVQAYEEALVEATGGTLAMDVESISSNECFGAVLGTLRATKRGQADLAIPFCGVWRFSNGKAVEHWENALDAAELGRWLALPAGL
ncbi:hypothetical protein B0T17DRAFT_540695 [Bombardia bombarda]|uniref:SnoaL-like domain-containing protein n=1 Tax=Bombardia bombarda TaxID=252184 RepID=A0AA39WGI0_9PEZI|nr:hypothetical protein B0T17DRAFT_540695 [Bombardia bombarda]